SCLRATSFSPFSIARREPIGSLLPFVTTSRPPAAGPSTGPHFRNNPRRKLQFASSSPAIRHFALVIMVHTFVFSKVTDCHETGAGCKLRRRRRRRRRSHSASVEQVIERGSKWWAAHAENSSRFGEAELGRSFHFDADFSVQPRAQIDDVAFDVS